MQLPTLLTLSLSIETTEQQVKETRKNRTLLYKIRNIESRRTKKSLFWKYSTARCWRLRMTVGNYRGKSIRKQTKITSMRYKQAVYEDTKTLKAAQMIFLHPCCVGFGLKKFIEDESKRVSSTRRANKVSRVSKIIKGWMQSPEFLSVCLHNVKRK